MAAQTRLSEAGRREPIEEVVADKGYHAMEQLELAQSLALRTYIPEPEHPYDYRWTDKPAELKQAVYNNRRRTKTDKNRRLQRLRSERVERTFAHLCDTGGARRSWLRGIDKVRKRLLITAAGFNLGLILRKLLGSGKPRALQGVRTLLATLLAWLLTRLTIRMTPNAAGCSTGR